MSGGEGGGLVFARDGDCLAKEFGTRKNKIKNTGSNSLRTSSKEI